MHKTISILVFVFFLCPSIEGQSKEGREIIKKNFKPVLKNCYSKYGKFTFDISVNRKGKVVGVKPNYSKSIYKQKDHFNCVEPYIYGYVFQKDLNAPEIEKGSISIHIEDPEEWIKSGFSRRKSTKNQQPTISDYSLYDTEKYLLNKLESIERIRVDTKGIVKIDDYSFSPKEITVRTNPKNENKILFSCNNPRSKCIENNGFFKEEFDIDFRGRKEELSGIIKAFEHLIGLASKTYELDLQSVSKYDPFINTNTEVNGKIEIPITEKGNVFEVFIDINKSVKTNIMLDTGASEVFLSPDIIMALARSGSLAESDFLGTRKYSFANGTIEECKRYNLRSISIGEKTIYNVECAVANEIISDMLLGQSFLKKLGKYEMDYNRNLMVIDK